MLVGCFVLQMASWAAAHFALGAAWLAAAAAVYMVIQLALAGLGDDDDDCEDEEGLLYCCKKTRRAIKMTFRKGLH